MIKFIWHVKLRKKFLPSHISCIFLILNNCVEGGARVEGITEALVIIQDSDDAYGVVEFAVDPALELDIVTFFDVEILNIFICCSCKYVFNIH